MKHSRNRSLIKQKVSDYNYNCLGDCGFGTLAGSIRAPCQHTSPLAHSDHAAVILLSAALDKDKSNSAMSWLGPK